LPQIPEQSTVTMYQQTNVQVPWHQFEGHDPNYLTLQMQPGYGHGYSLNPSVPAPAPYQPETSSAPSTFSVQSFSGISPQLTTFPFQPTATPSFTPMAPIPTTPSVPQTPSPAKGPSHRRSQSRPEISSRSEWMGQGSPSRRGQQSSRLHSPIRTHHLIPHEAPYPSGQPQATVPQPPQQSWDPNNPQLWVPETIPHQSQQQHPSARSPQRPGHRKNPSKSQPRGGRK